MLPKWLKEPTVLVPAFVSPLYGNLWVPAAFLILAFLTLPKPQEFFP
jgi:hypothetical protein